MCFGATQSPEAGTLSAGAQNYFPMKKGAVLEYRYYGNNGRPLRDQWGNDRWTRFTVEDLWGDSIANVAVENETFDRLKGADLLREQIEPLSYGDVRVSPTEVVYENVLWGFIPSGLAYLPADIDQAVENLDKDNQEVARETRVVVTLSATAPMPREPHVGDSLPELRYEASFREEMSEETRAKRQEVFDKQMEKVMSQVNIDEMGHEAEEAFGAIMQIDMSKSMTRTMTAIIRNRRVEAFEKVAVPAGEYDCWKISYEIVGPTERVSGLPEALQALQGTQAPVIVSYVDYISPEVGLVKREKLNFRGNRAEEVMTLTSLEY